MRNPELSSVLLAVPLGLSIFLAPRLAHADGAPPLRVQLRVPAARSAALSAAIAAETGRPVQPVAPDAACAAPCVVVAIGDGADTADVRYIAAGGESRARAIALPSDDGIAAETIALLADNLVSDEAAGLIAGMRPGEVMPVAAVETFQLLPAVAPPMAAPALIPPSIATTAVATAATATATAPTTAAPAAFSVREQRPRRFFAFGLVPLLSTDLQRIGVIEHEVSLDLLVGVSGGTTGFSAAGVLSVEHGRVDGFQLAGVGVIADDVDGGQGAGAVAAAHDVEGTQAAGALTIATGRVHGGQLAGAANLAAGPLRGFQLAGSLNVAGPVDGLQGAGAANLARGAVDGTQIAGALNVGGPVDGVQIAGALNTAAGSVDGAQIAGALNLAAGAVDGAQVAGAGNVAGGMVRGAQVAGAFNVATSDVRGAQIAPFNFARRLEGLQVGVVNVAGSGDGTSIGLITIVPGGRTDVEASVDSGLVGTALLRHGSRRWHNVYGVGGRAEDTRTEVSDDDVWMYGLGMGPTWHVGRAIIDLDGMCWQVNRGQHLADDLSLLAQARLSVGYPIGPITLVAGAVSNTYISTERGAHSVALRSKTLGVRESDMTTDGDARVWIWPTAFVGVRL